MNNEEKILAMLEQLTQEQASMRADIVDVKATMATKADLEGLATKMDIHDTRTLIENGYQRIENLLREDYGRVAAAADKVRDYDNVKSKVAEHDSALQSHNTRIKELEKKAI